MKKPSLTLAVMCASALLAACQTPVHHEQKHAMMCDSTHVAADKSICLSPAWILDALVDGTGKQAKVMVVLTASGISELKANIAKNEQLPIALKVGHHRFVSYDGKAITSGFLVLKPFDTREEAQHVVNVLLRK